ncbi:glycoside hydrolase family 3 protein [Krasilnikoviella flava]|uniref:beta-N-acetylhexosaminidase n=1 Tax=Krasilnikoviella flava TaxID=526729 RepID=A0A1T5L5N0_9MICO|nr:glycoside hydrolase family 3 protein [Krasilnikoviella flava]SKC71210.1 beta-N-acetylhexosaminidase [Krasilnikoviella flava]
MKDPADRRLVRATAAVAGAGLLFAGTAPAQADTDAPRTVDVTTTADVGAMVEAMTLDQKIGQMTWTHVYGSSANDTSMAANNQARYGVDTPAQVVQKYDLGGVLYFAWSGNTATPQQVNGLSNGLQDAALADDGPGIPLAVTIDQEGGLVARVGPPATQLPGNMALGATFDAGLARAQGDILGSELKAMGVNVDFAPVLDLNTNPDNPVIGIRSMGADPDTVSKLGVAQIEGIQQHIAATAKHFPGHGDTETDSHYGLPEVTYDRATLEKHLRPFQAAIDAGVDMIMTAHIVVDAIDPELPGTLSPAVLTGLLREEMGFDGIITTDALDMEAMTDNWSQEEMSVLAVQAGSDILLNSPDVDASMAGVKQAVADGTITEERIDASVTRILEWKAERGILADPYADPSQVGDVVGSPAHLATAATIADRSMTLLRNEDRPLPLQPGEGSVLVVGAGAAWPERLAPMLAARGFDVTTELENGSSPSAAYRARAVAAAASADAVVFTSYNASGNVAQQAMVEALAATGRPVIVVAARNPYDVNVLPGADAVLNSYGYNVVNYAAVVRAIAGDIDTRGKLPVAVPTADGGDVLLPLGFGHRYPAWPRVPGSGKPGR